ncbi:MAG: hypothetical protein H6953_02900 [Chromatiaceae bacterium]|nr:hypothetical protein [Chromatiaceae bacterium]MCP5314100.1 hypothetical protein [Chromatiaceae bacterium]
MSEYEKFSVALQLLLLIAAVIAAMVYFRQLHAMQRQLKVSLESSSRLTHLELLKLAIEHPDLIKVWQQEAGDGQEGPAKQHLFVNLHLSHLQTLHEMGSLSDTQLKAILKGFAKNTYYQAFWRKAKENRLALAQQSGRRALRFHGLCESAFSGYEPARSNGNA